jgi:hypothetical protein
LGVGRVQQRDRLGSSRSTLSPSKGRGDECAISFQMKSVGILQDRSRLRVSFLLETSSLDSEKRTGDGDERASCPQEGLSEVVEGMEV